MLLRELINFTILEQQLAVQRLDQKGGVGRTAQTVIQLATGFIAHDKGLNPCYLLRKFPDTDQDGQNQFHAVNNQHPAMNNQHPAMNNQPPAMNNQQNFDNNLARLYPKIEIKF